MKKVSQVIKEIGLKSAEKPIKNACPPFLIYEPKMPKSLKDKMAK